MALAASSRKPLGLFLLHLPPPIHGSSIVGDQIRRSVKINEAFECVFVNILASKILTESGQLTPAKLGNLLLLLARILVQLVRSRPDFCYLALTTTGIAFFRDVIVVGLLRLFRVKRIYHMHNKGVAEHADIALYRILYGFVFKGASVIVLSDILYADIKRFVPRDRALVCGNGIEADDDSELSLGDESPTQDGFHILFLSNLMRAKGVFVLLQACAILRERGLAFFCDFVGAEGDVTQDEFKLACQAYGVGGCVGYLGRRYGSAKASIFRSADVFVLPTFRECFPLVIIEAMSYGLPVVACPEGGIPDLVEEGRTGYLVSPQNAEALASRIEVLIKSLDLRRAMGAAGRQRYLAKFTYEAFEARMVNCIESSIVQPT